MMPLSPELITALGGLIETAIKIGVSEGPVIAAMIEKAAHGGDPLAVLAAERVDDIVPGLRLEMAMASARVAEAARKVARS